MVNFTLRPLYSQGKSLGIHLIGGWVSPSAGLDAVVKRKKILDLAEDRRKGSPHTGIAIRHGGNVKTFLVQPRRLQAFVHYTIN
jgi:hypothetical protein